MKNQEILVGQEKKKDLFKKFRKLYDAQSIRTKIRLLSQITNISLRHIKEPTYDSAFLKGNIENPVGVVQIPLGIAGPLSVQGKHATGHFFIPMATTEGALVLTYDLGMRLLARSSPIYAEVLSKCVHISPMFQIRNDQQENVVGDFLDKNYQFVKKTAEATSKHLTLLRIDKRKVGDNLILKFLYDTGDAHGLNMINHATFEACKFIERRTGISFYLRSHYSGVKHHSSLNEREGYGRVVKAWTTIPQETLEMLSVTAQAMKDFCDRCIECGHAAGITSVNVHAANAIAAVFLACGQDAADLSSAHVCEGSTALENNGKDLYWECTLRNLLVGTVGGGTGLGSQRECLEIMGCYGSGESDKFAELIAATVLAGEFPTAAAVVNRTYVDIHNKYGRNKEKRV